MFVKLLALFGEHGIGSVNAELLTADWDDFQNIDSAVIVKDIDDLKI